MACVVDCGGDWDDFDARLTRERSGGVVRGVYLEPLWSHLLDPRERLAADGLGAAELAGGAAHGPKAVARQPLEALVSCALQQGDAATARAVLRAAHRPGFRRDWVRRRTIELDRELGREGHV
ncbi:hypothetical protein [Streptomyces sp. NPDC087437]|uniref:hypothetical protein n=1 Tax=Streptomyces sp. NPDC087437 TaxID=3365789 RepID=UPI0038116693